VEIKRRESGPGIVVLEMSGSILMGPDCERIEQELEQLLRQNETWVIFDLSGISTIDSTGVGKIVNCFSRLKKSGGSLRLAGLKGMVERAFKLTQVHKVIGIYPTALDATEGFPSGLESSGRS
jgi:anti-sigma B factor antagonist